MKVVFVGPAYPLRGGIAQFNGILVRALRARGHEVRLLTFTRQYPGLFFPGRTQTEEGSAPAGADVGAEAVLDSIGPLTWRRTAREIVRWGAEAVVFRYWMPFFAPCFGTIARWIRGPDRIAVLYLCDNVVPHERRFMDGLLTRYALSSGDAFLVMTRAVEADLRRYRPDAPAAVVPHPVFDHFGRSVDRDEARRALASRGIALASGGRPLLLFFGIVRPYKGLDVLLRAMPRIVRETGAGLVVAGEFYSGRDEAVRLVADLRLEADVAILDGYVPHDDVAIHMCAADVVVLPYRSATQSGIVQVAYQFDRPVIVTDVGGLAETVRDGETGLLVPPDDPEALAVAVGRYFHEGMEESMRGRIRMSKGDFSWDRMAEALELLIAGVRSESGGSSR